MTDTPERIWAASNFQRWAVDSGKLLADHGCDNGTEYVRADLLDEAVKALEAAAEDLEQAQLTQIAAKNMALAAESERTHARVVATLTKLRGTP